MYRVGAYGCQNQITHKITYKTTNFGHYGTVHGCGICVQKIRSTCVFTCKDATYSCDDNYLVSMNGTYTVFAIDAHLCVYLNPWSICGACNAGVCPKCTNILRKQFLGFSIQRLMLLKLLPGEFADITVLIVNKFCR